METFMHTCRCIRYYVVHIFSFIVLFFFMGSLCCFVQEAYAKKKHTIQNSLILVEQKETDDHGTHFRLHASDTCTIIINTVDGLQENGTPELGRETLNRQLKKGETVDFNVMMSKNLPNLCVTCEKNLGADIWCPQISGMDGSLILAPNFQAY